MKERSYTIILDPDLEGQGYTVTVPALPCIVTQGDTIEQAIAMGKDAIRCHIGSLLADGLPGPEETEPAQAIIVKVAA